MAKNRVVVPKKFQLAGYTWNVHYLKRDAYEDYFDKSQHEPADDEDGCCAVVHGEILISKDEYRGSYYDTHVFFHELVHAIMHMMGEYEHDERFVDSFAWYLQQFLETQSGEHDLGPDHER